MILVPEEQAASFGLETLAQPPVLPPPDESPVPDVALQPPPPDAVSGVGAPMAPQLTGGFASAMGQPPPVDQGAAPAPAPITAPQQASEQASPPPNVEPPAPQQPAPAKPLSATTYDDLAARQQQDTQAQVAAAQNVGEAEAQQAQAEAAQMAERDRIVAERMAAMEHEQAREQQEIARKTQVWEAKQQEWMNSKVTRRSMGTGELVMAAIAGFGSAWKGQGDQNPALPVIMAKIQQDVDDQIRERDQLGKQVGALKGSVDYAREVASNAQAQRAAQFGLELQKHGMLLETVAKKMEPGIKRANMQGVAAKLRADGTAQYGQALQLQHGEDQQKAALAQSERESKRQVGLGYARIAADERMKKLDYAAAALDIEAKRQEKVAAATTAADKEAAAREVPDLLMQNDQLYQARDDKAATDVAQRFAAAQSVNNLVNDLKRMRSKYGNKAAAMQSPEWQQMVATNAAIANTIRSAEQMGALDKGALEQMGKMMGGASLRDGVTDQFLEAIYDPRGNPSAGLEQLQKNVATKFNDHAKALRHPRGPGYQPWNPPSIEDKPAIKTKVDERVQSFITSETPDEIRGDAKMSRVGRFLNAPSTAPVIGGHLDNPEEKAEKRIASIADVGSGGILTKGQDATLDKLEAAATSPQRLMSQEGASKAAEARKALVAAATGAYDKGKHAVAQQAIDKLAVIGAEEELAEVAAHLKAGAKSEREIERALAPIKFARQQAELLRKPYGGGLRKLTGGN
jgi:hypothetical protein